jgi:hypothetical protein
LVLSPPERWWKALINLVSEHTNDFMLPFLNIIFRLGNCIVIATALIGGLQTSYLDPWTLLEPVVTICITHWNLGWNVIIMLQ